MKLGDLRKLIKELVTEARMREADVYTPEGGSRVQWGSDEHLSDLKRRASELKFWRDKSARGSEKRANYQRALSRVLTDIRSVEKSKSKQKEV